MKNNEIKVFISGRESICGECGENLGHKAWITLDRDKGALCLACAELEHLVFLPTGDAALTRRSRKHSTLSAVVLKWSKARKRYERQGLLIEEKALEQAEEEYLADQEVRERRKQRESEKRAIIDKEFVKNFAKHIRELFPNCPKGKEKIIAKHACLKYSGRVGRSSAAKKFNEEAIRLAVIAHIRHTKTKYDELISRGYYRYDARSLVQPEVETIVEQWEG
ncbi:MAG: DUF2293 domain-containing protein [Bacteroidales bacterium]|nr:DUF2293 domain-containing protein [Bacteroidales bacterium]